VPRGPTIIGAQMNPVQWEPNRPDLLTTKLLEWLESKRTPHLAIGSHVMAQWQGGGYWAGTITDSGVNGYLITWDDGSSPTWDVASQIASAAEPFYQIGHAEFGILLALLAGWIAPSIFQEPRTE
jgi:hypothetical protein